MNLSSRNHSSFQKLKVLYKNSKDFTIPLAIRQAIKQYNPHAPDINQAREICKAFADPKNQPGLGGQYDKYFFVNKAPTKIESLTLIANIFAELRQCTRFLLSDLDEIYNQLLAHNHLTAVLNFINNTKTPAAVRLAMSENSKIYFNLLLMAPESWVNGDLINRFFDFEHSIEDIERYFALFVESINQKGEGWLQTVEQTWRSYFSTQDPSVKSRYFHLICELPLEVANYPIEDVQKFVKGDDCLYLERLSLVINHCGSSSPEELLNLIVLINTFVQANQLQAMRTYIPILWGEAIPEQAALTARHLIVLIQENILCKNAQENTQGQKLIIDSIIDCPTKLAIIIKMKFLFDKAYFTKITPQSPKVLSWAFSSYSLIKPSINRYIEAVLNYVFNNHYQTLSSLHTVVDCIVLISDKFLNDVEMLHGFTQALLASQEESFLDKIMVVKQCTEDTIINALEHLTEREFKSIFNRNSSPIFSSPALVVL